MIDPATKFFIIQELKDHYPIEKILLLRNNQVKLKLGNIIEIRTPECTRSDIQIPLSNSCYLACEELLESKHVNEFLFLESW